MATPSTDDIGLAALHRELGIPADYAATHHLLRQAEAPSQELVTAAHTDAGRTLRLLKPAAAAWTHLHAVAATEGFPLVLVSGFRSVERQAEIIRAKRAAGLALADVLRLVAAPGYSEHHTGRAIDVGIQGEPLLEESFGDTGAFRWLERRAIDFGFRLSFPRRNLHGIGYEPWHWCWHFPA